MLFHSLPKKEEEASSEFQRVAGWILSSGFEARTATTMSNFFKNSEIMYKAIIILTLLVFTSTLFSCSPTPVIEEVLIEGQATEGEDGSVGEESTEEDEG